METNNIIILTNPDHPGLVMELILEKDLITATVTNDKGAKSVWIQKKADPKTDKPAQDV